MGSAAHNEGPGRVIAYEIGQSGQQLHIRDAVLEHFAKHQQIRFWQREAGGLLFARFDLPIIDIVDVTGPRRTDIRRRHSYSPDVRAEQREIEQRFCNDQHFVGCWHTHPEDVGAPSNFDLRNTADCVRRSRHALNGFLMIVVGRAAIPKGLFISVCDGISSYPLQPIEHTSKRESASPSIAL